MKKTISVLLLYCISAAATAQDLEPRAYGNLPKGTNAIAVVYGFSSGNVLTDPSLPFKDFKVTAHNFGLGYVRSFALAGKLARVQVSMPLVLMSGKVKINGNDTSGVRNGFGDARIRFGINIIGSPALDKKDFRQYRQKTIVGLSLVTSVPTGLYYNDKRINLGSNRWAFKPEVGVSHRFKNVYAEAYTGVWFYTNNNKFLSTKKLEQQPALSIQLHACYYFKNQMWIGIDGNWFNGGKTIIDNAPSGELLDNKRVGATWSFPVAANQSLKLQFHIGAFTNTGYDYNVLSLGYQYIFF
ncbi:MAG TPA: transporter [Panacibacter sp.]|nr:transporter [Panacibacter sp.]